jgi:ribonuclease-3
LKPALAPLLRELGYEFTDEVLLTEALTHRSKGAKNNERLEFLGDAILGFVIAEALYRQFPQATEGELSRYRALLVKKETLAALAREFSLGDYLRLGPGELKSGGFRRDSILADAMEAILGAIFLDSDMTTARDFVLRSFERRLADLPRREALKDPKTRLQEFLQARRLPLPAYEVVATVGSDHAQSFEVQCTVAGLAAPVCATGKSRRKAEQAAATLALEQLTHDAD